MAGTYGDCSSCFAAIETDVSADVASFWLDTRIPSKSGAARHSASFSASGVRLVPSGDQRQDEKNLWPSCRIQSARVSKNLKKAPKVRRKPSSKTARSPVNVNGVSSRLVRKRARKNVDVPERSAGSEMSRLALAMIYRKTMEEQQHTCPECRYHFRVSAAARIQTLVDPGSFEEMDADAAPKRGCHRDFVDM